MQPVPLSLVSRAECPFKSPGLGSIQESSLITALPQLIERALPPGSASKVAIPVRGEGEPEDLSPLEVKQHAYRAIANVAESYWRGLHIWRRRHREVCGLSVPGEQPLTKPLLQELLDFAPTLGPGVLSRRLAQQVQRVTRGVVDFQEIGLWGDEAERESDSPALTAHLRFSHLEDRLAAGLNSALMRTFEIQGDVLDALYRESSVGSESQQRLARHVLNNEQAQSEVMKDLQRFIRYVSSLHFEHFRIINEWLRASEQGPTVFTLQEVDGAARLSIRKEGLDQLIRGVSQVTPSSPRLGCPAHAARTKTLDGSAERSLVDQAFEWITEINQSILFPLVVKRFSRKADSN